MGSFPQGILQRDLGALVWVGREGLGLACRGAGSWGWEWSGVLLSLGELAEWAGWSGGSGASVLV